MAGLPHKRFYLDLTAVLLCFKKNFVFINRSMQASSAVSNKYVHYKSLPMAGIELRTSGIGCNRTTN